MPSSQIERSFRWRSVSDSAGASSNAGSATAVGYGPKLFQAMLRFHRPLNLSVRASAPRNLAQFSADLGYADQAHMTREVRRFSGSPPTATLRSARYVLRRSELLKVTGHPDPSKGWLSDLFKTDAGTPI